MVAIRPTAGCSGRATFEPERSHQTSPSGRERSLEKGLHTVACCRSSFRSDSNGFDDVRVQSLFCDEDWLVRVVAGCRAARIVNAVITARDILDSDREESPSMRSFRKLLYRPRHNALKASFRFMRIHRHVTRRFNPNRVLPARTPIVAAGYALAACAREKGPCQWTPTAGCFVAIAAPRFQRAPIWSAPSPGISHGALAGLPQREPKKSREAKISVIFRFCLRQHPIVRRAFDDSFAWASPIAGCPDDQILRPASIGGDAKITASV